MVLCFIICCLGLVSVDCCGMKFGDRGRRARTGRRLADQIEREERVLDSLNSPSAVAIGGTPMAATGTVAIPISTEFSRRLKGPLLVIATEPLPKLNQRAVVQRDATHIETRTSRASGSDAGVAAARGSERELLVGAADVIPKLNLRAVAGAPIADVNALAALHADDAVLAVASISHSPALVVVAVVSPLDDLRAVGCGGPARVQRLAAVAHDNFVGGIGNRAATATAGLNKRRHALTGQ